jgi:hypothetical protein
MAKKKAKKNTSARGKDNNVPGAMTIDNPTPEIIAAMAPYTGRFKKLHELWDDAKASNVRARLVEAWGYANHNDMTELNFVVALSRLFAKTYPQEPLPVAAE